MEIKENLIHQKEYFSYIDENELKCILLNAVTKKIGLVQCQSDKIEVDLCSDHSIGPTRYYAKVRITRHLPEEKHHDLVGPCRSACPGPCSRACRTQSEEGTGSSGPDPSEESPCEESCKESQES